MQMNLCLSGLAGCYAKVHYPEGIEAAVAEIRQAQPDAVTFNEACGGDVARIARQTGYHLRFSSIVYYGKRLPCINPRGPWPVRRRGAHPGGHREQPTASRSRRRSAPSNASGCV